MAKSGSQLKLQEYLKRKQKNAQAGSSVKPRSSSRQPNAINGDQRKEGAHRYHRDKLPKPHKPPQVPRHSQRQAVSRGDEDVIMGDEEAGAQNIPPTSGTASINMDDDTPFSSTSFGVQNQQPPRVAFVDTPQIIPAHPTRAGNRANEGVETPLGGIDRGQEPRQTGLRGAIAAMRSERPDAPFTRRDAAILAEAAGAVNLSRSDTPLKATKTRQTAVTRRSGQAVTLAHHTREITRLLLGRENKRSPFPECPSTVELAQCEANNHPGPTKENFRLNVSGKKLRCRWNKRGARVAYNEYLEEEGHLDVTFAQFEAAFLSHIETLSTHYLELKKNPCNPDGTAPAPTPAQKAKAEKIAQAQRQRALGQRRERDVGRCAPLKRLQPIFNKGVGITSLDEYTAGPQEHRKLVIVPHYWRSKTFTRLIRAIDLVHLYYRNRQERDHPDRGSWPAWRYVQEESTRPGLQGDLGGAVPGLPRNCYGEEWLKSLRPDQIEDLDIQPPVDLSIPDDVKEIVRRFESMRIPGGHPQPSNLFDDENDSA
ncbi:hypothetical protein EIP91_004911 [Steccherinum ochraceum]|uniref:Uncharacterized protein n=1 Tax=Steccherinum ochraceum TaxID=92696 RepID=A0A4R0RAK0_9APHY|nr:hypothetical protein EIP91_004911 [Steccherinum ochraceum]